jgi:hypothetical protein
MNKSYAVTGPERAKSAAYVINHRARPGVNPMRETVEKQWRELENIWQELYSGNTQVSPFQSYEYLDFTGKGKPYFKDPFRLAGVREFNLVLYRDEKAIAIAPMLVKRKKDRTQIFFRGHFTRAGRLDFVYREGFGYEDFKCMMDGIISRIQNPSFFLDRVFEGSPTSAYMQKYFPDLKTETKTSYAIPIPQNHEEWRKNLRKSARNNINNYIHRMERDQTETEMKFYCEQPMDEAVSNEMLGVYAHRYLVKNNCCLGLMRRPVIRLLVHCLKKDRLTQWLSMAPNNYHAILYINHEIAAFTCGLISNGRQIALVRLAINTKFARYGPGCLLLSDVVKHATEKNQNDSWNIQEINLGIGGDNGMEYKQSYGGQPCCSYTFTT